MSSALSLNLNDPRVKALMGADDRGLVREAKPEREFVQLAGDQAVRGEQSTFTRGSGVGAMQTLHLDGGKHETLVSCKVDGNEFVMTVDVYALEGEPLQVHYICPRCRKQGRITSEMKAIEWSPSENRPITMSDGRKLASNGVLSVEPFQCSWELNNEQHATGIRAGGLTLCRLKLVIDNNVAREA